MPNQKTAWPWLWLSLTVIMIDQLSKHFANAMLVYNKPHSLFPFFNLTLKYNRGAAFSFLSQAGGWQVFFLSGISVVVSVVVFIYLIRTLRSNTWQAVSLSLILGGAIGNLIDRFRFHYVTDFFDFHLGAWHFATFNVADSAISIGAILLMVRLIFFDKAS